MKHKNFQTQQDRFAKNAQSISKIYQEVVLLMKNPRTKPQVKNVNINFYDLYYTVIKNRKEKDIEEEHFEIDFISLNDVNIENQYVGINGREKRDLE